MNHKIVEVQDASQAFNAFVQNQVDSTINHNFEPLNDSFADGDWDGRLGYEPTLVQWSSEQYRKGYLEGIQSKYNKKYSLV